MKKELRDIWEITSGFRQLWRIIFILIAAGFLTIAWTPKKVIEWTFDRINNYFA